MTVPLEVPAMFLILRAPRAIVVVAFVQGVASVPQVIASLLIVAVPSRSGFPVSLPLIVALEHVATVMPPVVCSFTDSSLERPRIVLAAHLLVQGSVVDEQRTPSSAEAVPRRANRCRGAPANGGEPSILTYFMLFLLDPAPL